MNLTLSAKKIRKEIPAIFSSVKSLNKTITYKLASRKIRKTYSPESFEPEFESDHQEAVCCFESALNNAVNINTVPCVYDVYNSTGLLTHLFMIRAGGNYNTPWTRDAAINTWNAMRFINPKASRTTLLAVCTLNGEGEPIIQPDKQTWDQVVWAIGAWNYYLATGDNDFIVIAHGIIKRVIESHRKNRFNEQYQLFVGGSFFNDGIAGYPLECHETGLYNSFGPAHRVVETIMCLSTNCLYCEAYRIYGEISELLGNVEQASEARQYHLELKNTINRVFFSDELGRYRYILYPDGHTDDSQELSGHIFSVLFDICPKEKQSMILNNLVSSERGTVSLWPPFEGLFSDEKPGRHNNVIWPFLNGMLIQAAAKCGAETLVGQELDGITELYKNSGYELYEIYSPYTGKVYGGWQLDYEWDSCHDQTWSATCYIGGIIQGVFGINILKDGVSFTPCVPEKLKDSSLKKLSIRGMKLDVKVKGFGTKIDRFVLDGKDSNPLVAFDNRNHNIEITLK